MDLTASAPRIAGTRTYLTDDGQRAAATGWQATATNNSGASATIKVAVICAKIGA